MTKDELQLLNDIREQVFVLRRVQQKMLVQHRKRMLLLDEVIAGQKQRDEKLDRLLQAAVADVDADDWWKK